MPMNDFMKMLMQMSGGAFPPQFANPGMMNPMMPK